MPDEPASGDRQIKAVLLPATNTPWSGRVDFCCAGFGLPLKARGNLVRLSFLDSIRGLAAFVLTAHLNFVADVHAWFLELWVLPTYRASIFAGSLFFVLSGFVLFLQVENDSINYVRFVIRRAFRTRLGARSPALGLGPTREPQRQFRL